MTTATPISVSARTVWIVVLNVAAALAVASLLRGAAVVVTWAAIAMLLAMALDPAVSWCERHRVPRSVSAIGVVILSLGAVALFVAAVMPPLVAQGRSLIKAAPALLEKVRHHHTFRWADDQFGIVERAQEEIRAHGANAAAPILGAIRGVLEGAVGFVTVVVLTIFMLVFGRHVAGSVLAWVHPAQRPRWARLAQQIRSRVGAYVAGTIVIASIGGLVSAVTLALVGVPYVFPLGLATAVLGLVPFIGVTVAAIAMVATTLAAVGLKSAVVVGVTFLVYQQVENHVLQPLIQRKAVDVNPLVIASVMLVATSVAGIWGALFALPAAGAVKIVLDDVLAERQRRWTNEPAIIVGTESERRPPPGRTSTVGPH